MDRITQGQLTGETLRRLQGRLDDLQQQQERVSTGRDLNRPSDNPAEMDRALVLRADEAARAQQKRNAENAQSRLEITDSTMDSINDRFQRARDLAVTGASESSDPQSREAIADEIDGLLEDVVELANAEQSGRGLFSGYQDGPAVEENAAGDFVFNPDGQERISTAVGLGAEVDVNVTAAEMLDAPVADGNSLELLRGLSDALRNDDLDGVDQRIGDIDEARETLNAARSVIGVSQNRVESAIERAERDLIALGEERSSVEDANMAEAIVDLQTQEVAYEATLGATSRVLQPTLLDFIR